MTTAAAFATSDCRPPGAGIRSGHAGEGQAVLFRMYHGHLHFRMQAQLIHNDGSRLRNIFARGHRTNQDGDADGRCFCSMPGWIQALKRRREWRNEAEPGLLRLLARRQRQGRSSTLMARRSSMARYPSATFSSGSSRSKTLPGWIFSSMTRRISSGR